MSSKPHIVIVGGGVIGLSSAIALLDHPVSPYNVTVVATDLPSFDSTTYSPNSSQAAPSSYSSAWAGAHHVSDAKDEKQLQRDKTTFEVLKKLETSASFGAKAGKENQALVWVHQTEYWQNKKDANIKALDWYPNFHPLPSSALPEGTEYGCTLSTYDIVVPHYLPQLYRMFLSLGGQSLCRKVTSISEAISLAESVNIEFTRLSENQENPSLSHWGKPSAAIVSPGLGAIEMLDDTGVHPVRGQTLLVKAPWCTTTLNKQTPWVSNSPLPTLPTWPGMSRVNNQGFRDMYILPRGDGTFIVGGTRLPNDWNTQPREETTQEIVDRALSFMPILANPDRDEDLQSNNVNILGVNVGLRPARKDGVRLEEGNAINQVPVIYSYGYGGYGYQCSWGAAFEARDLVDGALQRPRVPPNSTLASLD